MNTTQPTIGATYGYARVSTDLRCMWRRGGDGEKGVRKGCAAEGVYEESSFDRAKGALI